MDGIKEQPGIIPRSMNLIFDTVNSLSTAYPGQSFLVRVTYLEVGLALKILFKLKNPGAGG